MRVFNGKSRRCGGNNSNGCFWVTFTNQGVYLRDRKVMTGDEDFDAPALRFSDPDWKLLMEQIKFGGLSDLSIANTFQLDTCSVTLAPVNGVFKLTSNTSKVVHIFTRDEVEAFRGIDGESGGVYGSDFDLD